MTERQRHLLAAAACHISDLVIPGAGMLLGGRMAQGAAAMAFWLAAVLGLSVAACGLWLHPLNAAVLAVVAWVAVEAILAMEPLRVRDEALRPTAALSGAAAWIGLALIALHFGIGQWFGPLVVKDYGEFPGLLPGEVVLVQRFRHEPERGILVVAEGPSGPLVARVVGLPGDRIEMLGPTLKVNESMVPSEDLGEVRLTCLADPPLEEMRSLRVYHEKLGERGHFFFYRRGVVTAPSRYEVGPGEVFLVSDNRSTVRARDSREVGALPAASVRGRPGWILWSTEPGGRTRFERIGAVWE